jgi:hypothetical protein
LLLDSFLHLCNTKQVDPTYIKDLPGGQQHVQLVMGMAHTIGDVYSASPASAAQVLLSNARSTSAYSDHYIHSALRGCHSILATIPLSKGLLRRSCTSVLQHLSASSLAIHCLQGILRTP